MDPVIAKKNRTKSVISLAALVLVLLSMQSFANAPRQVKVSALFVPTRTPSSSIDVKLSQVKPLIAEAGNQNSDVVVLPETYFQGRSSAAGAQQFDDSVVLDSMKVWAKTYNINIVFQVYELELNPTKLYNTVVFIDRNGEFVGKYRKVNLAPGAEVRLLTPGDSYPVFEMDFGKAGALICWDGWFTDPSKTLVQNGAEIILIPTSENNYLNLATITAENGVPIIYSVDHINDIPSGVWDHHGDSVYVNYDVGQNVVATGTVTLGSYKNLALGKTVQALADEPEHPASNAVDDKYSIERDAPADSQTSWKASSLPQWIEIDLGDDYDVDRVSIAQFNSDDYTYRIEGRATDGDYELLGDQVEKIESHVEWDIAGSEILSSRFEKKKVRYVKLTVDSDVKTDVTINEIKVFGYSEYVTKITGNNFTTPRNFDIYQNYPNPFNAQTTIPYMLSEPGYVKLAVYNMQGRLVRELVDGAVSAGEHMARWDGRDASAQYVSSGVYIYRIEFHGASGIRNVTEKKMIFLK